MEDRDIDESWFASSQGHGLAVGMQSGWILVFGIGLETKTMDMMIWLMMEIDD